MGLYRQIAGNSLGLFIEAANMELTNGGGGGQVYYDPGFPIPVAIPSPVIQPSQPLQPLQPVEPITNGGSTSIPAVDTTQPVIEPVQTAAPDIVTPVETRKKNYLPAITLGALLLTMTRGDQVFKKYKGVAFLGGLGALFYQLSKTENGDAPTPTT